MIVFNPFTGNFDIVNTAGIAFTDLASPPASTSLGSTGNRYTTGWFSITVTASDFTYTGTKTANFVLAGPTSGSAAIPSFRALVAADIPAGAYGGVTSLTGTANQITVSAATGAVTVSIPVSPTFTTPIITTSLLFNNGQGFFDVAADITGLTAGVPAALTNASMVIYDSTGQAYRVPCII